MRHHKGLPALLLAALISLPAAASAETSGALAEGVQEEPCAAETDDAKRVQCLRKGRDSESLYHLGMAYRLLKKASKKGSAAASLELARIYQGSRRNEDGAAGLALDYAERSCGQKSPDGCTLYGVMLIAAAPEDNAAEAAKAYDAADGKRTAEELFLAAEQRGIAEASLRLGEIYRDGLTVPQNYQLAADEFRKAALQGSEEAMNDLAVLYTYGLGVEQSYSKARELYEKAVGLGSSDAMNNLAMLYQYGFGVRKSYPMTARLLESAARQGNAQALYNLAIMRIRGQYYDRDEGQAFDLMSEAAKQNHPEAAANLGWMYWNGVGTAVNRRLGCRWWDNAVIAGNDTAKENLRRLCKDVNLSEPAVGRKADGADDEDVRPAPEARNMKKGGNRSRPADKKALRSGS